MAKIKQSSMGHRPLQAEMPAIREMSMARERISNMIWAAIGFIDPRGAFAKPSAVSAPDRVPLEVVAWDVVIIG